MASNESTAAAKGVVSRTIKIMTDTGSFRGVLAVLKGAPWRSATVVIGENHEVDEDVAEVARRLAAAGHAALAIGHDAMGVGASLARVAPRVDAALSRLKAEAPAPPARFGAVGFGVGGYAAIVAGNRCRVGAAVSFYGEGPMRLRADLLRLIDQPKRHAASLLFLLGGEDAQVRPADLGVIHDRLDAFGMRHTFIIYPRTRGAFCRPGGPDFREREAADAWDRLVLALETAPRLRHRFPPKTAESSSAPPVPPASEPAPRARRPASTPLSSRRPS